MFLPSVIGASIRWLLWYSPQLLIWFRTIILYALITLTAGITRCLSSYLPAATIMNLLMDPNSIIIDNGKLGLYIHLLETSTFSETHQWSRNMENCSISSSKTLLVPVCRFRKDCSKRFPSDHPKPSATGRLFVIQQGIHQSNSFPIHTTYILTL
jgi:hypothetical protein